MPVSHCQALISTQVKRPGADAHLVPDLASASLINSGVTVCNEQNLCDDAVGFFFPLKKNIYRKKKKLASGKMHDMIVTLEKSPQQRVDFPTSHQPSVRNLRRVSESALNNPPSGLLG